LELSKHIIGHIGDGFYGSNDPTNSVKAPKEYRARIWLQSHEVHPAMLTIIQHMQYETNAQKIHTDKHK